MLRSRPALIGAGVIAFVAMAVALTSFSGDGQRSVGGPFGSAARDTDTNGVSPPTIHDITPTNGSETGAGQESLSSRPKVSASAFSTTPLQSGSLDVAPTRVSIASATIDAEVIPVGNDAAGNMEIPSNGAIAGWYQRSVVPGRVGTSVITAHVDTRQAGAGAFFQLRHVRRGDVVDVVVGNEVQKWQVTDISQQPKDQLPRDILFHQHDRPLLALITCTGTFDRSTRSYRDNLIVYAELVRRE